MRKAAPGCIQLMTADAEVEKCSVEFSPIDVKNLANFIESAMQHLSLPAKFSEAVSGDFHS
jgi:hypothetical protein